RAVPGARIEDDEGTLSNIEADAIRRQDANQGVVHRPRETASVQDQLGLKGKHMRSFARFDVEIVVATLTKHIQKQRPALHGVDTLVLRFARRALRILTAA